MRNHEIHQAYLDKWEEYRDKKIELTAIFIKVLKRKNFLRRYLRLQKANEIFCKVVENLKIRREFNRIKCMRYFVHIKFLIFAKYRLKKTLGPGLDFRRTNEIRRCFNFAAVVRH